MTLFRKDIPIYLHGVEIPVSDKVRHYDGTVETKSFDTRSGIIQSQYERSTPHRPSPTGDARSLLTRKERLL